MGRDRKPPRSNRRGFSFEFRDALAAYFPTTVLRLRFDRIALLIGLGAVVALSAMWLAVRRLPPTLTIWSLAFSAYLPAPLYVLGMGGWLYTFVALARRSEARCLAWGMALIALGGLRWDVAYCALLTVVGCLAPLIAARSSPAGDEDATRAKSDGR